MFEDSALYWLPKIENIDGINVPRTEIIEMEEDALVLVNVNMNLFIQEYGSLFENVLKKFDFPLFIRTDEMARKRDWENTCYVKNKSKFYPNLKNLVTDNLRCGEKCRAILIREFIPLEHLFVKFTSIPVSKERRYFIKDGKILCHHAYWNRIAFENSLTKDEELQLKEINKESEEEIKELSTMALKVAKVMKGSWSIDFAKSDSGKWFLIDMATANHSEHPEECEFNEW